MGTRTSWGGVGGVLEELETFQGGIEALPENSGGPEDCGDLLGWSRSFQWDVQEEMSEGGPRGCWR